MPRIACPECSAVLKLKDASLLGKSVKCPKCGHRFVVQEPAQANAPPSKAAATVPRKPKAARRVSETPPTTATATATSPPPVESAPTTNDPDAFPGFVAGDPESGGTSRLRELARKRAKQRRRGMLFIGAIGLCLGAAIWAGMTFLPSPPPRQVDTGDEPPQQNEAYLSKRDRLEQLATLIREDGPTQGEPITLDYIPAGASIIVHLHPAELWKPGSPGEELRYCLGQPFNAWLTSSITKYCGMPPAEIEEATICLILGARGSEPEVTAVVRPLKPLKTSELIQRFDGSPQKMEGIDVFVGTDRAAVISQERDAEKRPLFYATAPAYDAQGLAMAASGASIASEAIMQLLPTTDRDRLVTIVFQPSDLEIHQATLFGSKFEPLVTAFREYFDEEVEAAAWSIHFTGEEFVSELALRNAPATTPTRTLERFTGHLDSLAPDLVDLVSSMNPTAIGDRKLVGRLPAMAKVVDVATVGGIDQRLALFQARLPERAAGNLALAGLLTWYESLRTDALPTSPGEMESAPQKSLAQRLKTPIEIDFRRTPLEPAFEYIGGETGVTFEVDGGGLKLAGYTKNMEQNFKLGSVPAERAIAEILKKYDQMVVVLDDAKNVAIVTTKAAAEQKGLTPATFAPE